MVGIVVLDVVVGGSGVVVGVVVVVDTVVVGIRSISQNCPE